MRVSEMKGVKVYDLSSGKSVPQFIEEAKYSKRKLKKMECKQLIIQEYRSRIELIQDFSFPGTSQRVRTTEDGNYIHCVGLYPPSLKIFETAQLSLKCERRIDSQALQIVPLSPDYTKLAMLCEDRNIELHAQYGFHYKARIPRMGRDMTYNPHSCELLAVGSSSEIYRLNLERGQFMNSFQTSAQALNAVSYNSHLGIVAVGGEEGVVQLWNSKDRDCLISLPLLTNQAFMAHYRMGDVTSLAFSKDSLSLALGDSHGKIKIYDLRYPLPLNELQHQYQLPIINLKYHGSHLISADRKVIKIFDKDSGSLFCPFEPPHQMNDFEVVPDSGLFLTASESSRIGVFYIPEIGGPPKWCSFLETLTEELEEGQKESGTQQGGGLHGDYQFVTALDMQEINAGHLIGSKLLRPFLHGFFIDRRLYEKLKGAVGIDEQTEARKLRLKEKALKSKENRIVVKDRKSQVTRAINQDYARALLESKEGTEIKDKVLNDPRFAKMWKRSDFLIDEQSEAFKLNNPTKRTRALKTEEERGPQKALSGRIIEQRVMNKRNQHRQDKKGRKSPHKRRVVISAWKL